MRSFRFSPPASLRTIAIVLLLSACQHLAATSSTPSAASTPTPTEASPAPPETTSTPASTPTSAVAATAPPTLPSTPTGPPRPTPTRRPATTPARSPAPSNSSHANPTISGGPATAPTPPSATPPAPTVPEASGRSSLPPGQEAARTVSLADNGQTIVVPRGGRVLLNLDGGFTWSVRIADPAIVSRVPNVAVIRGAQGIYEGRQPGRTSLTAVGVPPCRSAHPFCATPELLFRLTIVVR